MTQLAYRLHDRCLLQEVAQTPLSGDDEGSLNRNYITIRPFWCRIEDTGGREITLNRNVGAGGSVRVRVRASDVYKKDQFVRRASLFHFDRVLKISSVERVSKREMILWCDDVEEEDL